MVDLAVPGDTRSLVKKEKKTDKYSELNRELQRLWEVNVCVILVVVGALGIGRLRPFLGL